MVCLCFTRSHVRASNTFRSDLLRVCGGCGGRDTPEQEERLRPSARSLAPCNFWCGARARPPRAQTTAVRTEASRVAACTRHRGCLIIWSCRCKTLQLSCVALISVKSYLHTPALIHLVGVFWFVLFCPVFLFLKKSHDSIKENLWICTKWLDTGCFIIIFSYVSQTTNDILMRWDDGLIVLLIARSIHQPLFTFMCLVKTSLT